MLNFVSQISEFLKKTTGISEMVTLCIIRSILLLVLIKLIHKINVLLIIKYKSGKKVKYTYNKTLSYAYLILSIFILVVIWHGFLPNIFTFLGLFTAGVAFALKDALVNFVAGVYILTTNNLSTGDRIEINGIKGDVVDIELSHFTLLEVGNRVNGEQSSGRFVHIPNSYVFIHPLMNYDKGFDFIWHEIDFRFTLDSDIDRSKELLYEIVDRNTKDVSETADTQISNVSKDYLIYYNNLTPIVYTRIENDVMVLTLRYLCKPRKIRVTESAICEDMIKTFRDSALRTDSDPWPFNTNLLQK